MKKIFIVAGELSGDKLGAWYVNCLREKKESLDIHAVGGDFLEESGAKIYERFEKLNVTGIVEIVRRLSFILRFLRDLAEHIIDLVDNHPYYVQHYSHVIWDISEKKVNKENLERALNYTLSRESAVFLEIWDRLRLNQKKTLVALALKDKNEGIFSQAILKHFSLPPVSSLQKSLKALYNQELIEKADGDYRIVDLFFKLWIKTSWG